MSALWSQEQHEWLRALGHPVLTLASATTASADPVPMARSSAAEATPDSPLWRALLCAAGRPPGAAADAALAGLPDPAALRGNAAAKRALWPRLRALRRQVGPR
ncbi:hypothetical protein ACFOLC_10820 [Lysobacter cavernae]|uniref:Uncharacterized protein n=1 Tax=Lysobacter cavernae TaxID=1685901 RepID=A0ABV7RQ51_9GAMM